MVTRTLRLSPVSSNGPGDSPGPFLVPGDGQPHDRPLWRTNHCGTMPSMFHRRPRAGLAAALAAVAVLLLGGSGGDAASSRQGIDVSHSNGSIDWSRAYAAGQRFVFAKASEGRSFKDGRYAGYRRAARVAGFRVGAYHFARPDSSASDAIHEADHFLDAARPASGDLLPVLDLEDDGGLSTTALKHWVWRWVRRVRSETGLKPMIYTNPSFWHDEMGDARAFAAAGYRLWIAHYGTSSLSVPAANWDGHGATFWQYTKCGSVSGVSGCVDRDRYLRANLAWVTIP